MDVYSIETRVNVQELSDNSYVYEVVIKMPSVGHVALSCVSQRDAELFLHRINALIREHTIEVIK